MTKRKRMRMAISSVIVSALAASAAVAGPQQPFDDTTYWTPDWTGSIATVTVNGLKYPVATADLTYQGAEATPTIRPKVGQRFYVRIRTHKTNYQNSAGYRMRVLLPAGVDADITSSQDVVCTLTDFGGNILPMLPGECQDPVRMGLYWEFATMTLHSGETGWYWFPVKASQPQASTTMQLLSQQMTYLIGAVPDPMVGSVPLRVDPASLTVPSPPLNAWTVSENGGGTISWSAPSSNGGSAISWYTASARAAGSSLSHSCSTTPPSLTCSLSGLVNGTTYGVTVTATNAQGTSAPSVATTLTPQASASGVATVPSAPTNPFSAGGFGTEMAEWSAPASDGGSPVTGYTARAWTASVGGTLAGSCSTTTLSCTILNTSSPQTMYYIDVVARNGKGDSLPSARVASTRAVVAGAPPCPVNLNSALSGNRTAAASWTRPSVSPGGCGGVTEVQYQVRATDPLGIYRDGCVTSSSYPALPPTTCTVSGLSNGTPYTLDVIAYNFLGWGRASNALAVTPLGPPDAPASVVAKPGDGSAVVSWGAVADGGRPVTGLTAFAFTAASEGAPSAACSTTGSGCSITGLTNGTTYFVEVAASNALGTGPGSSPRVAVTPNGPIPGSAQAPASVAPAIPTPTSAVVPSPRGVTAIGMTSGGLVGWRPAPAGWRVTGYLVRAWSRPRGGVVVSRCVAPPSRRSCRLRGVAAGRRVYVDVTARTVGGLGKPSSPRRLLRAR